MNATDTLIALKNNAYNTHNAGPCCCIRTGLPWCSEAMAIALAKRPADLPNQHAPAKPQLWER